MKTKVAMYNSIQFNAIIFNSIHYIPMKLVLQTQSKSSYIIDLNNILKNERSPKNYSQPKEVLRLRK